MLEEFPFRFISLYREEDDSYILVHSNLIQYLQGVSWLNEAIIHGVSSKDFDFLLILRVDATLQSIKCCTNTLYGKPQSLDSLSLQ